MTFSIIARRSAKKFLDVLPKEDNERINNKIKNLANDPFPREAIRVHGRPGEKIFRIRVGIYRILYFIDFQQKLIVIDKIDKRSRAYD